MKRLILCVAAIGLSATALAQSGAKVAYTVSFPNAVHHEAQIEVVFHAVPAGPLKIQMSRASPGRYAIHEFAKNVYNVTAQTPEGRALKISQTDPYSWNIEGHSGSVIVTYTLYADRADGTYSQIDLTHAHLNAPATFMWAQGLERRPVAVRFIPPSADWKVATQLVPTEEALTFYAPDFQYFMDSPVELSNHDLRSWTLPDGQTIRMAVHHTGTEEDVSQIVEKTKKVVNEQIKVFGEAPKFDYGTYTFIADYIAHANGDGMEHRNSTILTRPDGLREGEFAHLGTISHEFIHAWNVERIRPADLEPFDFTTANPSASLWFAEGFTSYYGPLTIRRAGEQSVEDYAANLGRTLSRTLNAPGRQVRGPAGMSLRAPFVDAATAIDPTNNTNTFVSYYSYGAMIGLALDLTLRSQFEGITLDDYMKRLWQKYGKSETPYTNDNLRISLGELTGDQVFAEAFFANYVYQGSLPDYAPLLMQAGFRLESAGEKAWIGNAVYVVEDETVRIVANTRRGSPLYQAGLDRGDEIVSIGGEAINRIKDIEQFLMRASPGDQVEIAFIQRGISRNGELTLGTDPALQISLVEAATPAQLAFRKSWIGEE